MGELPAAARSLCFFYLLPPRTASRHERAPRSPPIAQSSVVGVIWLPMAVLHPGQFVLKEGSCPRALLQVYTISGRCIGSRSCIEQSTCSTRYRIFLERGEAAIYPAHPCPTRLVLRWHTREVTGVFWPTWHGSKLELELELCTKHSSRQFACADIFTRS